METHNNSFNERYVFEGKAKTWSLIAIVIGIITIIAGLLVNADRTFSNLLLMAYYFTCVCTAGAVFCAIQYAAQAGWSASMIRIPQAFAKIIPYAAAILIIVIGCGIHFTHNVIVDGQTVSQTIFICPMGNTGINRS